MEIILFSSNLAILKMFSDKNSKLEKIQAFKFYSGFRPGRPDRLVGPLSLTQPV
jgi:hypothetical protein